MSSLAQYYQAGQQAGKARNRHDESLCQHHTNWMRGSLRREGVGQDDYRKQAEAEFNRGYREERLTL